MNNLAFYTVMHLKVYFNLLLCSWSFFPIYITKSIFSFVAFVIFIISCTITFILVLLV